MGDINAAGILRGIAVLRGVAHGVRGRVRGVESPEVRRADV